MWEGQDCQASCVLQVLPDMTSWLLRMGLGGLLL
jgi:hypothetical protein